MSKLKHLFNLVYSGDIQCNPHRTDFESVKEFIARVGSGRPEMVMPQAEFDLMVATDTVHFIELHFSNRFEYGRVFGHDYDEVLEISIRNALRYIHDTVQLVPRPEWLPDNATILNSYIALNGKNVDELKQQLGMV